MMTEQTRQHYLSLLGVDSYVPRFALVGARPSVQLEEAEIATAQIPQAALPSATTVATSNDSKCEVDLANHVDKAPDVHTKFQDVQSKEMRPQNDSFAAKSVTDDSNKQARGQNTLSAIRFVFSVWVVNEQFLVIDERQIGSALPTDHLLLNILRALQTLMSSASLQPVALVQLPHSEPLRWPLFGDQLSEPEEAQAMVNAYIEAKLSECPSIHTVLLMGEDVLRYTLGDGIDFAEQQRKLCQQSGWPAQRVCVLPNLANLLQAPLLKRDAWQTLRALAS